MLVLSVLLVVGFGGWLIYKYKVYPYNRILKYHHGNSTLFDWNSLKLIQSFSKLHFQQQNQSLQTSQLQDCACIFSYKIQK